MTRTLRGASFFLASLLAACGGSDGPGASGGQCEAAGLEGCPCAAQGLCLGNLVCVSGYCVNPGSSSGSPTGNPGTSGVDPTTGGTSSTGGGPTTDPTAGTTEGGTIDCPEGQTRCGEQCFDLDAHPQHCGDCNNACAEGGVCADGKCATIADCTKEPCPGFTYCDEASKKCLPGCAYNPQCAAGQLCDTSTHTCECQDSFYECGGVCIGDNPDACGDNCTDCPAPANGYATCQGGACDYNCNDAYTACGGDCYAKSEYYFCSNGLQTCTPCGEIENGDWSCQNGDCVADCDSGYIRCPDAGACKADTFAGPKCTSHDDCCVGKGHACEPDGWCGELIPCKFGCPTGQICLPTGQCSIPCTKDTDCPNNTVKSFCWEEQGHCFLDGFYCGYDYHQGNYNYMGMSKSVCWADP